MHLVSILLVRKLETSEKKAMESKPHVALSTTPLVQVCPPKSLLSSSALTGSFLIRAPLTTTDDEDDGDSGSDFEPSGRKIMVNTDNFLFSGSSSNGDVTEGFVSGEEFETASERHFGSDPVDGNLENGGFVNRYQFSRPFVGDPDEVLSQNSIVDDEYDSAVDDAASVDDLNVKRVMVPVAQLSLDDDGFDAMFSGGESEKEDHVASTTPRIKVKVMEVDGGEDGSFSDLAVESPVSSEFVGVENGVDKSFSDVAIESPVSGEFVKVENGEDESVTHIPVESSVSNDFFGVQNGENESFSDMPVESPVSGEFVGVANRAMETFGEAKLEKEYVNDLVSDELVEERGNVVMAETNLDSSMVVGGKDEVFEVSHDIFITNLDKLKVKSVEMAEKNCGNSTGSDDVSGSVVIGRGSDEVKVGNRTFVRNFEESRVEEAEMDLVRGGKQDAFEVACDNSVTNLDKSNTEEVEMDKGEPYDYESSQCSSGHVDVSGRISLGQGSCEDKTGNETEQGVDMGTYLYDPLAIISVESGFSGTNLTLPNCKFFQSSDFIVDQKVKTEADTGEIGGLLPNEDIEESIFESSKMNLDDEIDNNMSSGKANKLYHSAALATNLAEPHGDDPVPTGFDTYLASSQPTDVNRDTPKGNLSEEEKETFERIQLLERKFSRLVQKLGHSWDDNTVVEQVLYKLNQSLSLASGNTMEMKHEIENGKDDLDFSLNLLVIGKTGVGKSSTINSIFGETKTSVDAFQPGTTSVKIIDEEIDGTKIRVIDTPGLRSSVTEQNVNRRILASVKRVLKKFPPDVVLYVDRLDSYTSDCNDLALLKSVTGSFGSSIWQNAILTLTHADSDSYSGFPLDYETFVAQRSRDIQWCIVQSVGEIYAMRNLRMMHRPVSLIENRSICRTNSVGGTGQLLLLCYSLKILCEANDILKTGNYCGFLERSVPLPYWLSSLLRPWAHPKLFANVDSDIELCDSFGIQQEDEDDDKYSELPPLKSLGKSEVAKLSKEQRKAYFEEYDYRLKLFLKKQLKGELKRSKEMKKRGRTSDYDNVKEDEEPKDDKTPVMSLEFVLPASDGDNPVFSNRFIGPTSRILTRPMLGLCGWDHGCGCDGVSLGTSLDIAGWFPCCFSIEVTKDKKEMDIYLDSVVAAKHRENGSSMAGFSTQTVGRWFACVLRGETECKNCRINKTSAGFSVTLLGKNVATGIKLEDQVMIRNRLILSGSAGAVGYQSDDVVCGVTVQFRLQDRDFPIKQDVSSFGLSLTNWRGNTNLTANFQSRLSIGRSSKMVVGFGMNNKRKGQITVKFSSSEQLQMALIGIVPIVMSIFKGFFAGSSGGKVM